MQYLILFVLGNIVFAALDMSYFYYLFYFISICTLYLYSIIYFISFYFILFFILILLQSLFIYLYIHLFFLHIIVLKFFMALTKNFTNIINKWRIENLYYKNWRNEPHSIYI